MMRRGANGCRRFEWSSCLHLQGQAIHEERLTLKTKDYVPSKRRDLLAQRRSVTTQTTSIFNTRKYVDHCLFSPSSRSSKGGQKSEKLVREIRIHAFVTGWSYISDGENKKPLQNFGVDTANIYIYIYIYIYCQGVFLKDVKQNFTTIQQRSVYTRRHILKALRTDRQRFHTLSGTMR
jgi:hypothetical protein